MSILRSISFFLGICLLAVKAIISDRFSTAAIWMDVFHLISISILSGGLVALVILLPIRKRKEGEIFFGGIIYLFLPWALGALLILAAVCFSCFFVNPFYGKMIAGKLILSLLMLAFVFLYFLKVFLKNRLC